MTKKDGVRIKMLKTDKGADDGVHVQFYHKGFIYTVTKGLAQCFLSTNSAEVCPMEKSKTDPTQNKALPGAPQNKAQPGAPQNKSAPRSDSPKRS